MKTPTLHLNGTSREHLQDPINDAYSAGMAFLRALEAMSPNARDYYPQGPEAFGIAVREHEERYAAVKKVMAELVEMSEAIDTAHEARYRR